MSKEKIYIIVDVKDESKIDWSKLHQSPWTARKSKDMSKILLSYYSDEDQPQFIFNITGDLVGLREYNHSEILNIVSTNDW